MIKIIGLCSCVTMMTAACAHMPDVETRYYLAQSSLSISVVRTIMCDANNELYIADTAVASTRYSRDADAMHSLQLAQFGGTFRSSDIGMTFREDGRLQGINASSTGQGGQVLRSAISLFPLLGGLGFAVPQIFTAFNIDPAPTGNPLCSIVKAIDDEDPITIRYGAHERFDPGSYDRDGMQPLTFRLASGNPSYATALAENLPPVCGSTGQVATELPSAQLRDGASLGNSIGLHLRQPARARARVYTFEDTANQCGSEAMGASIIWSGSVSVPQLGTDYVLPIPRAGLFSKQTFKLALAESGTITSISYGVVPGTVDALATANAAATALQPDTNAEIASALDSEADIIAQQTRLIRCRADPANCT